jgi:transcriptional regulator
VVKIKIVGRDVGEVEENRRITITIKIKANIVIVERDLRIEVKRSRRTIKIGINRSRTKVKITISGGRREYKEVSGIVTGSRKVKTRRGGECNEIIIE